MMVDDVRNMLKAWIDSGAYEGCYEGNNFSDAVSDAGDIDDIVFKDDILSFTMRDGTVHNFNLELKISERK